MKKKKSTLKDKLKNVWFKIRKPLIVISFILNAVFISVAFIGCANQNNKSDSDITLKRNDLKSYQEYDYYVLDEYTNIHADRRYNNERYDIESYNVNYIVGFDNNGDEFQIGKISVYARVSYPNPSVNNVIMIGFFTNSTDSSPQHFIEYDWINTATGGYWEWSYSGYAGVTALSFYNLNPNDNRYDFFKNVFDSRTDLLTTFNLDSNFNPIDLLGDERLFSQFLDANFPLVEDVCVFFGNQWFDSIYVQYSGWESGYNPNDYPTRWNGEPYNGATLSAVFYYLEARNSITGNRVIIYQRDTYTYIRDGAEITLMDMSKPPHWTYYNYSNVCVIKGLYNVIDSQQGVATLYDLFTSQSYYYSPSTPYTGGSSNPFGLISQAFASMTSIFGMAILPGITIGTLIFIPLVVAIVLAVVKLIKKG